MKIVKTCYGTYTLGIERLVTAKRSADRMLFLRLTIPYIVLNVCVSLNCMTNMLSIKFSFYLNRTSHPVSGWFCFRFFFYYGMSFISNYSTIKVYFLFSFPIQFCPNLKLKKKEQTHTHTLTSLKQL